LTKIFITLIIKIISMVKQFTIPCQFGNETSPVTLYIGHPETTHHPVHFQADWLSSSKGGTIPQDLMDSLQKLHDLANENGADFEELCYYALISATQNGNGATKEDINKFAQEFIEKEENINNNNLSNEHNQPIDTGTQKDNNSEEGMLVDGDIKTQEQQKEEQQTIKELEDIEENNQTKEKIQPTISLSSNKTAQDNQNIALSANTGNSNNDDADLLEESTDLQNSFSQEDEDLLLDDDLSGF